MMKECPKCKKAKELEEFPKDKQNSKGIKSYCRVCSSKLAAKYYKKNKHKRLTAVAKYYKKIKDTSSYKLKNNARLMITELVRKGIIKKLNCAFCGKDNTQAHHYLGYEGENALKIVWLCKLCHEREHHPSPLLTVLF